jgi:hypothetical protein
MFTLSDIIDTKQRLIDRYNSPEYLQGELSKGYSEHELALSRIDKTIALNELLYELMQREILATTPVNIEKSE